jgi:AraC-like DNA-binding protein
MKIDGIHEKELFEKNSLPLRILTNQDIDFQYPPHWHNAIELLYIEKNDFIVYVNSKKIFLKEKDIIFIPSGVIHEFQCVTTTGTRYFVNFEITELNFVGNIKSFPGNVRVIKPEEEGLYQAVKKQIDRILREQQSPGPTSPFYYVARLIDILILIGKNTQATYYAENLPDNKKKVLGFEKINKTFEYIEKHYKENIRLTDIANAAGFSEYYFSRIFKDITEKSFHQYLNEFRIKKAISLLDNENISISQAANESGFSSIATFDRLFKQIIGCTPQEYRKLRV